MDIFKSTTFTWWQLGMLKWAVLCVGIAIGATWADMFSAYILPLLGVGLFFSLYLGIVWMRRK